MKIFFTLILSICCYLYSFAQILPKGQYFEAGFNVGKIYKHSPKIVIPLSELKPVLGAELTWEMKTFGKKHWNQLNGYPRLGFIYSFQDFRDERLGWGMGLMPFVSGRFFKIGPVELFGRMAMGISYVSKHYDAYTNPENNIIGSHINSNVAFRLGLGIDVHKKIELRPSFSFTHYSNGASQFPNLGINVMSFHLGVLYKDNPITEEDKIKHEKSAPKKGKVIFNPVFGIGIKEIGRTYRGPKFPVILSSLEAGLFLSRNNMFKIGVTHEYNASDYAFINNNVGGTSQSAVEKANRFLFYIDDEISLGHISIIGQIGYYFNNAPVKLPFTRIGFKVYPLDPVKNRIAPYIGLRLKAHAITAEYFDLIFGCLIR